MLKLFKIDVNKDKVDLVIDFIKSVILIGFSIFGLIIDSSSEVKPILFILICGLIASGIWIIFNSISMFKKKTVEYWYILTISGVISIGLAIFLYFYPLTTHQSIGIYFGIYAIAIAIIHIFVLYKSQNINIILTLVLLILGIISLVYSEIFIRTFYTLALIITGVIGLYSMFNVYLHQREFKDSSNK